MAKVKAGKFLLVTIGPFMLNCFFNGPDHLIQPALFPKAFYAVFGFQPVEGRTINNFFDCFEGKPSSLNKIC